MLHSSIILDFKGFFLPRLAAIRRLRLGFSKCYLNVGQVRMLRAPGSGLINDHLSDVPRHLPLGEGVLTK